METLYEIPNRFRITLIREVQRYADSPHILETRATPFLIEYRGPNAEKAEHCELTDEVFKLFLSIEPEIEFFETLLRFLPEKFMMSAEMAEHLRGAPKSLLEYCLPTPKNRRTYVEHWLDVDKNEPPEDVEVLVCVVADNQRYVQLFARFVEGEWYSREGRRLLLVDYWRYKATAPEMKSPKY